MSCGNASGVMLRSACRLCEDMIIYLNNLDNIPGSQDIGVKLDMSRVGGESYHCFSYTIHAHQCVLNPAQGGGQPTNLCNIESILNSSKI